MPIEIERKFLVVNSNWKKNINTATLIKQGYLNSTPERTVRVRIKGEKGFLTIKGKTVNTTRAEYEYEIPFSDALEMMDLCEKPLIEKTRYEVIVTDNLWEIDVFDGDNKGLTVAEIELESENQEFILPSWAGKEVSHDAKYYNASLIKNPFKGWD
jgi:adenylate cyclase